METRRIIGGVKEKPIAARRVIGEYTERDQFGDKKSSLEIRRDQGDKERPLNARDQLVSQR